MSDTVGYRARGAIKGLVDTVWDMLGDLPASGTSTAAQRGLPELGGRCYSASALTAGTAVYVSTRTAVGGFPVATVSAAATGTNVATYIMGADIAAGGTGTMVKGAIIKTALDAHLSSVGAAVYFGAAGLPTLTPGSQQVGRVHTATTNAYVAFDVWDSGGVAAVGTFAALDGTAAAPGYAFAGSGGANEGLYRPGNGEVALSLNGLAALDFASSAPTISAGADTAGQDVYLFATSAGTGTTGAKVGAAFRIRSGAGGPAATTIASGDGGAMAVLAGGGGNKTGTTGATGAGGALSGSAGAGGDNATVTAVAAGIGGAADYRSGAGGNQTGAAASGAGGAGGAAAYGSGAGGNASGAGSTGNGGAGGQLDNTAGAGGTSVGGTGGAGGNFFGRAGAGGNGVTGGAGGTATIRGGNAGTGGDAAGGNVDLIPGTPTGTGLAGEIRVNSSTAGFIPVSFYWGPGSVDTPFFVASRAYRVKSIRTRVEVAGTDGGAVTAVINKAASGTAITAGTILHTGTIDLKGTAATNQTITLTATVADLEIAAGTCIGIDFTGTLTSATGCVTVTLAPV